MIQCISIDGMVIKQMIHGLFDNIIVPFLGSVTGVILRAKNAPINNIGLVIYLFGGTMLSYFITPAIAEAFNLSERAINATSFVMGAVGLLSLEAVLQIVDHIKNNPDFLKGVFKKW